WGVEEVSGTLEGADRESTLVTPRGTASVPRVERNFAALRAVPVTSSPIMADVVFRVFLVIGIGATLAGCGGFSASSSGGALHVRKVNVQAMFLVANPANGQLYFLTNTAAGGGLFRLNPATGATASVAAFPYKPSALAIADDGHTAYVDFMADDKFVKVDLATGTLGTYFSIGSDPVNGQFGAPNLAVPPGQPDSVVINYSLGGYGKTALFTNGVIQPNVMTSDCGNLTFAGPGVAYGDFVSFGLLILCRVSVDASGVTLVSSQQGVAAPNNFETVEFASGLAYTSVGEVLDPATNTLLGTCAVPNNGQFTIAFTPAPSRNRVYYVDDNDRLVTFETQHDTLVSVQQFNEAGNPFFPEFLVPFGEHGLALITPDNTIALVDNAP
ncbi:MAG: hypothetical protein ACHQ50_03070, partial [Fimbriimonadales bacterium]